DPGNVAPNAEQLVNGGSETFMSLPVSKVFGWTIGTTDQAQVSINSRAHTGQRSLQVVFSAPNKLDRVNISQTIVVQPKTQYHFECYVRTEQLRSASTPMIIILDAADGKPLITSAPLPTGSH